MNHHIVAIGGKGCGKNEEMRKQLNLSPECDYVARGIKKAESGPSVRKLK